MTLSINDVQLSDLWEDPYPVYEYLREHQPVAWVPAANRYFITRQQDIIEVERNTAVFTNNQTSTVAERAMGEVIMRKDGHEHLRQRIVLEAPLKPRTIKEHWAPLFEKNAETVLGTFKDAGSADLVSDLSSPLAAMNLASFLGLQGIEGPKLIEWCDAIIAGSSNYADDPEVWERCDRATAEIDAALAESMTFLRDHPDPSVVSSMMHAKDPLTLEQIKGNIKVLIGGGINEPRDALSVGTYGLLTNPSQRADVMADPALWKKVFEEAVRWVAPIGMYPRQVAAPIEIAGVQLSPGDDVGLVVASGNRDGLVYERPDVFDIHRSPAHHVAFGAGPHFCAGAWVARASIGQAAYPRLFGSLRNLRLDETREVRFGGWVFRGLLSLPVVWDN